jgi:hypothetical protein
VLASEDISIGHPDVSCSFVVGKRGVGLARFAYKQVLKLLVELLEA